MRFFCSSTLVRTTKFIDAFKTRFARLCKRAKASKIFTPYGLRHTFASTQSDSGTETTSLSRLMGHSTTRTLVRYVSNTFASHRQAVCTLQDHVRKVIEEGVVDGLLVRLK